MSCFRRLMSQRLAMIHFPLARFRTNASFIWRSLSITTLVSIVGPRVVGGHWWKCCFDSHSEKVFAFWI